MLNNFNAERAAIVPLLAFVAGCATAIPRSPMGRELSTPALLTNRVNATTHLGRLYVGSARISEYKLGTLKPLRSVRAYPEAIALVVDNSGHLFSANGMPTYGAVDVYDRYSLALLRQIETVAPAWLAVDHNGFLFVSNSGDEIEVYSPGGTGLSNIIRRGVHRATAMEFSSSGELYVADAHAIALYSPTKTQGHMQYAGRISIGATYPVAIAFNKSGDLAVANCVTCFYSRTKKHDYVSIYHEGSSAPALRIVEAIKTPRLVAFDGEGTLFVGNAPFTEKGPRRGWVSVYASGESAPLRIVRNGIDYPSAMGLGSDGYLYVGNERGGGVTVYRDRGAKLVREILRGAHYPAALTFGS